MFDVTNGFVVDEKGFPATTRELEELSSALMMSQALTNEQRKAIAREHCLQRQPSMMFSDLEERYKGLSPREAAARCETRLPEIEKIQQPLVRRQAFNLLMAEVGATPALSRELWLQMKPLAAGTGGQNV